MSVWDHEHERGLEYYRSRGAPMSVPKTDWNDPKAKIAGTHFKVGEVLAKSGYTRMPHGPMIVGFVPAVTPRRNATKHALAMEELRRRVNNARRLHKLGQTGITINSWARSWKHNREVGGAQFSQHLFLLACDITLQEIERLCPWKGGHADFDAICSTVFAKGGFGTYAGGNRHVDSRHGRARWSSWTPGR